MTQIILVRHGQPEIIEHDPNGADPALTDEGLEQANAVGDYLRAERIDAIWSSPMLRAQQTAAPLAGHLGLDVHLDDRFMEFDAGDPSYAPPHDLTAMSKDEVRAMLDRLEHPDFPAQVRAGMDDAIARHEGQRVAIFCHGGVIAAAVATSVRRPDMVKKLMPVHTGVTRIRVGANGFRSLRSFNEAQWID